MLTTDKNGQAILAPEQVESLLILPLIDQSITAQVATVTQTDAPSVRFPKWVSDPTVSWTAEGDEIQQSEPDLDEVNVYFSKTAGLFVCSRELFDDANTEAINEIGNGLVRQMANSIDAAMFATKPLPEPAQPGLASTTPVDIDGATDSLDPFFEAQSIAEGEGMQVDTFVCHPTTALNIATLKESANSNRGLLQPDATLPGVRTIGGTPLLVSKHVEPGVVWSIPKPAVRLVIRKDAEVIASDQAYFSSDRIAIRGTMRVGIAHLAPQAITRITMTDDGSAEGNE